MNWEAIGAVGEVLGAATVLITLGYLAVQIRHSNQALQNSALGTTLDFHGNFDRNERYIALLMKSQREEELTPEDRAHMVERFLTIMRELENMWYLRQQGTLSLKQFQQHLDLLRWSMSMPDARLMWVHLAPTFDPAFCSLVESEALAEGAPTSGMVNAFLSLGRRSVDQDPLP
jgi:hypothetical protein